MILLATITAVRPERIVCTPRDQKRILFGHKAHFLDANAQFCAHRYSSLLLYAFHIFPREALGMPEAGIQC